MNDWTSVEDGLPVERENPLTQDFCEVICAVDFGGRPRRRDIRVYKYGNGHFWHGPQKMDGVVTHWMYLPDGPKDLTKVERIRQFGEVFTPLPTVREMLDTLEKQNPAIFDPERTFLEPACGDGAFVVEILRRKFERCRRPGDYRVALESVYGFEIQPDNVASCIRNVTELCYHYFRPAKQELQIINDHIIQCDSLKVMKLLARMQEEGESHA